MNSDQMDRLAAMQKERHPVYRILVIDNDGAYLDDTLHYDLSEAQDIISNYSDAVGVLVVFEVIQ